MTLCVRGLTVMRANKTAVDGVSFDLAPGRVTALLGPNGAGKSSLVLALCGVLPAKGEVALNGAALIGRTPDFIRRAGVAAVPEGHRVLWPLCVDENLRAAGFSLDTAALKRSLDEVYAVFPEMAERKAQIAGSMSGGQQQMLALGQALIARPKYILADEMSFGLAPVIVRRLMQVVRDLAEAGTGILLIEQFTDIALALADDVHVMSQGRFAYGGKPSHLRENPDILHAAYLGASQTAG